MHVSEYIWEIQMDSIYRVFTDDYGVKGVHYYTLWKHIISFGEKEENRIKLQVHSLRPILVVVQADFSPLE